MAVALMDATETAWEQELEKKKMKIPYHFDLDHRIQENLAVVQ